MRLPALVASFSVLLSQTCLAENFSIFANDSNTKPPQINLAIDRDNILHQDNLIIYRLRWYNPYTNQKISEFIVANCATRQRGRREHGEALDAVSLYSVYPNTVMATELDIACGVKQPPNLPPIPEVSVNPLSKQSPTDAWTPAELSDAYRMAQHGSASAFDTVKRAAEHGNTQGQVGMGYLHLGRTGPNYDYAEAMKWFAAAIPDLRERANRGEAWSQLQLAEIDLLGYSVTVNVTEGVALLRKASDQGYAPAKLVLAHFYAFSEGPNGWPVPQDYNAAFKLGLEAANAGDAEAQDLVATLYEKGHGVAQNNAEALAWYRKAASQGFLTAEYKLGMAYLKGDLSAKQDYAEAAKWLMPAAHQGFPDAQYQIGMMYYNGQGLTQDNTEAADWIHKAAQHGYPKEALRQLAQMYREGRGVPKDAVQADKWQAIADKPIQAVTNVPAGSSSGQHASNISKQATFNMNNCKPFYPPAAAAANESGTVRIRFTVGVDDQLMSSDIVRSSGFQDLDQAAQAALGLCKFEAARTIDGKPVQSTFSVDYVWDLGK